MAEKSKVSVITMGCPKNVVDSENLLAHLNKNNVAITENVDEAATVVINTCGFIQDAKQESIDAIVEAIEKKKRGEIKKIVVMGCLSERFKQELARELPEVDAFFGTRELTGVLKEIGVDFKKELLGERFLTTPSHYAYLKISEGCDNPCSFCAIPLMRGKHRSVPFAQLLHEARLLAGKGVKELIVIGQDTTYYGLDESGNRTLAKLLGSLHDIDGIEWMRLMYAYPAKFPLDIVEAFQRYPKLCRYIDMPIQHIADNVLKSMRRGITGRAIKDLLQTLKREIPGLALRTTLIAGYPGETEDDFELLYDFVGETEFHRLGVFAYSQEEGTTAFPLGDPVPQAVKEQRVARIMELQREISLKHNERLRGEIVKILVDSHDGDIFTGRTQWDAPEIDQEVILHTQEKIPLGTFVSTKITDVSEYDLEGDLT